MSLVRTKIDNNNLSFLLMMFKGVDIITRPIAAINQIYSPCVHPFHCTANIQLPVSTEYIAAAISRLVASYVQRSFS